MTEQQSTTPSVVIVDGQLHPFHDFERERQILEGAGIRLTLSDCRTEEDLMALDTKADVLIYWGLNVPFTRRALEAHPQCRLLVRYGTGVDSVDLDAASDLGIPVAIPAGYCTDEVALHATALLLSLARRVVFLDRVISSGGWREPSELTDTVQRLSNQTLGLVGFGRIAQQVAKNMAPMVREIVCSDPYIDATVATNMGVKSMPLEDLLASSDLISVHLPLTTETEGLLGPKALNGVKRGAFLVNTSRGAVIDEVALAWALESGRLAGAGLDVFVEEPLPPNSPLRRLDNVVFTPHFASNSEEAKQDMFDTVLEIVEDAISGHLPPGLVNPSVTPRHPFAS